MTVHQDEIHLRTRGHRQMHDVTPDLIRIVAASGVRTGLAHVFNVGSTGALGTIEYEPGLEEDLPEMLDRLIPPSRDYGHERTWHDGNGHSHLQATLLGPELTVPVRHGQPALGTWQQVFHLECDNKPHDRRIVVTIQGGGDDPRGMRIPGRHDVQGLARAAWGAYPPARPAAGPGPALPGDDPCARS